MSRYLYSILVFFLLTESSFADKMEILGSQPKYSLLTNRADWGLVDVLSFIEAFLLKVVLPLVVIGTGLYVAYELFLAEGNEEKNKKAWKSLAYGAVGIISITLAYAIVAIISRISI